MVQQNIIKKILNAVYYGAQTRIWKKKTQVKQDEYENL